MIDNVLQFSAGQVVSATGNSTTVIDHTTAVKLFGGELANAELVVQASAAAGTSPTIRAQFVGADDAALTSNVVTLADTNTSPVLSVVAPPTGVPIYEQRLRPALQSAAKRFYGIIYTLGGSGGPSVTMNAHFVNAGQSNLIT